jgi:hypothetical protein
MSDHPFNNKTVKKRAIENGNQGETVIWKIEKG